MPLTAILEGALLRAPRLSADEWDSLRGKPLTMPCGARGVAKRSRLGTRFFAHYRGDCGFDHKPETPEHIAAKEAIILAATAAGWDARDEVRAPDGSWIADVLAEKGGRRVAIEVQWSRQGVATYRDRTARYARYGVETLWLVRHWTPDLAAHQPVVEMLPHADPALEHLVRRPGSRGTVTMAGVVTAFLDRRLAWSEPTPGLATGTCAWGLEKCWRCKGYSIVFAPGDAEETCCDDCGVTTRASRRPTAFVRHVKAAAAASLASEQPLAILAKRHTKRRPEGEVGFMCPHCRATLGWNYVDMLWDDPTSGRLRVPVGESVVAEHWCRRGAPARPPAVARQPSGDPRRAADTREYRVSRERLHEPSGHLTPWATQRARAVVGARSHP